MKLRTIALPAAGVAAYSFIEARRYRVVHRPVPVDAGTPPLSLLHLSDTHLGRHNKSLARWLRRMPRELPGVPDIVIATGDMVDDDAGVDPLVDGLTTLEASIGCFYVLGSHDYYESSLRGFIRGAIHHYSGSREPVKARRIDVQRLRSGLERAGWTSLGNSTAVVEKSGSRIRLAGVDDPFLDRHTVEHIRRFRNDDLAIALVHTPDVISEWALAGFDLILAGHTHGGQVRIPIAGAVVTNSSLPAAIAGGLHRVGNSWLHTSPGLGTSKFTPFRFMCRPEATLLELRPARSGQAWSASG